MRILLVDNATEFLFSCDSKATVICSDVNHPSADFDLAGKTVSVGIQKGSVSFGRWLCPASQIDIVPDANEIFHFNGKPYRGGLRIIPAADGNSFDVVNIIGIEPYLAGVIGAEMPGYWEPQALEAQAIAARTYCLFIKQRFGNNRDWDVRKTAAHQMYEGVSIESQPVWRAINNTAGKVLFCEGANGTEGIFPTYYGSTCAGHTENSKNVFGDDYEPLRGVKCDYCKDISKKEFLNWPAVYMSKETVNARLLDRYSQLKKLDRIIEISATDSSDYKNLTRLTRIKLEGANGKTDNLRAEDFRLSIDPTGSKIKSAAFEIRDMGERWAFGPGKGYGHGVGMCQCGAQGLARKGKNAKQILLYYYPGSKIKKLY